MTISGGNSAKVLESVYQDSGKMPDELERSLAITESLSINVDFSAIQVYYDKT